MQSNLLDCYAGNNPVRYTDPDGRASILQRVINDNSKNKAYHFAHMIGKITKWPFVLHGLVDKGELGGFKKKDSVYQYSGKNAGFTRDDQISKTSDYIIRFTGMDDKLTEKAAENVLATDRFGNNDSDKQQKLYKIFFNDCNSFTRAVFKEYKKLWKDNYSDKNPDATKREVNKAWRQHYKEISRRKGEVYHAND